jgi:acyl transferase domain-containing protein
MAGRSRILNHPPRTLDAGDPQHDSSVRPADAGVASDVVHRIRGEFAEMPGLAPSLAQAARLFHLPVAECERVFAVLLSEGFLRRASDGTYRVASE